MIMQMIAMLIIAVVHSLDLVLVNSKVFIRLNQNNCYRCNLRHRTASDPSWKPLVGERVPYVIVRRSDEGGGRVVDGVVPLELFNGHMQLNYEYYGK